MMKKGKAEALPGDGYSGVVMLLDCNRFAVERPMGFGNTFVEWNKKGDMRKKME